MYFVCSFSVAVPVVTFWSGVSNSEAWYPKAIFLVFKNKAEFLSLQDNKTKTWPPKAPWQHTSPVTNTLPSQSTSLYQMSNPVSQWNDTMQILQSPVWSTANDCAPSTGISSSFAYAQQQQSSQQQASQHKQINKGFKSFPVKHERRPSYLHQY